MLLFLPQYVKNQLETLHKNGFRAYVVGGCVRDLCMGRTPNDYDITTSATPDEVMALFENCIPTGIKHGTVSVMDGGNITEITTFRTENGYLDSRRPDSVEFVGRLEDDLMRRDFTVNSLAYNDAEGIIDLFGGLQDIENGILKTVGDAKERFGEDALRILRLFRFSAQLGFGIESSTLTSALSLKETLKKISRERIFAEIKRGVCTPNPSNLLPLINEGGLSFCGINATKSLDAISLLPKCQDIRLAAFFILCNCDIKDIQKQLRLSNKLTDYVSSLAVLSNVPLESRKDIKLALNKTEAAVLTDYLDLLSVLKNADTQNQRNILQDILEKEEPYKISQLDIRGNDLTALGFKGESVSEILNKLLLLVIEDKDKNRKEILRETALKYAPKH